MSSSFALNILAVVVAFAALTLSAIFAIRQITIMRLANQMPIFIDMIQEWRSPDFQRAEHYVVHCLTAENPAVNRLGGLTAGASLAISKVLSFFATIGFLVVFGILNEASAVLTLGYQANRLWIELEPLIYGERKLQGDSDFAKFFEDFVCRVRANWPPEEHYKVVIRRIEASQSYSSPPVQSGNP